MVTLTVGSGGDYANFSTLWTALTAIDPLTDDYTINVISSFTQPSTPSGVVDLGTHTLTVNSLSPHNGDVTAGYLITIAKNYTLVLNTTHGNVVVKNLKYTADLTSSVQTVTFSVIGYTDGDRIECYNLIGYNCPVGLGEWGANYADIKIYNCKFYNCTIGIDTYASSAVPVITSTATLENCTVYNCTSRGINGDNFTNNRRSWVIKNCVACECGTDWFGDSSNFTYSNCADSDNSLSFGTNNLHNIVAADEFLSLDSSSSNFLKLNPISLLADFSGTPLSGIHPLKVDYTDSSTYTVSGSLDNAGTVPTNAGTTDIAGATRPSTVGYAIGCHEAV